MHKVKVSSKGQLVIPQEMRNSLGIKEGSEVFMENVNGKLVIMRSAKEIVDRMIQLGKEAPLKISREEIKESRKEWKRK